MARPALTSGALPAFAARHIGPSPAEQQAMLDAAYETAAQIPSASSPAKLTTKVTIEANARYWGDARDVPSRAVTLGMRVLMAARTILLVVAGSTFGLLFIVGLAATLILSDAFLATFPMPTPRRAAPLRSATTC